MCCNFRPSYTGTPTEQSIQPWKCSGKGTGGLVKESFDHVTEESRPGKLLIDKIASEDPVNDHKARDVDRRW